MAPWRTAVRHRTGYEYAGSVRSSYNLARMTPCSAGTQRLLEHRVQVTPVVSVFRYVDYWGTIVHTFDVHAPHEALEVVATSVVETTDATDALDVWASADWALLAEPQIVDRHAEMLSSSTMVALGVATADVAASLPSASRPLEAVEGAVAWVRENIAYQRGVTSVSTGSEEVLASRRGVCQDFAHVTIALLRALGVPARYVSGYLYPDGDGDRGIAVSGESHAWVEAWLGEWLPADPTNGARVGHRHIRVAHGRDYADVPPLSGIYHGAPSKSLGVDVQLTRL
jgi:transglutaminase-like putative cysteine protease